MIVFAQACLTIVVILAMTFLPFLSGGYDFLAGPLAAVAWALGRVGLLLVPIGGLWLWTGAKAATNGRPGKWLARLTLGVCVLIALALIIVAFAGTSSLLLAGAVAAVAVAVNVGVARRLRLTHSGTPLPRSAAVALLIVPVIVWGVQSALLDPLTASARNRVINNAAPLIAEIEQYHARHGRYPVSLFAIWGDYKPAIQGVERYYYEPSGDAYNLIFREPTLEFGIRRFVVYNPRDKQRVTVHEHDRLRLDEAGLDADNAGYTLSEQLPQPHWKLFVFLS
jgi:hypothetical protein